jgi:hypothetical protein
MTRNTSYHHGARVGRIERAARLRWVPLTRMRVNPLAQRELRPARVSRLAAEFDVEQMGTPTVSHRGDWYYLIDGQHRIEALKSWLGAWQDQQVQCWCYQGLTEADEAEVFLKLNDTLTVRCLDRFKVAVQAGRTSEADIDRIVRALGLKISASRCSGGISATATLARVYTRGGPEVMSRALRIIRDAYGDAGLDGPVIDGIGLMCQRYDGQLPEQLAVKRLSSARGGVSGLLSRAGHLRQQTGDAQAQCVAAAAVEAINRGTGGKKLPSWWKAEP